MHLFSLPKPISCHWLVGKSQIKQLNFSHNLYHYHNNTMLPYKYLTHTHPQCVFWLVSHLLTLSSLKTFSQHYSNSGLKYKMLIDPKVAFYPVCVYSENMLLKGFLFVIYLSYWGLNPGCFTCMSELHPSPLDLLCKGKNFLNFLKTYKILTEKGCYDSYLLSVSVARTLEGFKVILSCMCCRPARATDLTTLKKKI